MLDHTKRQVLKWKFYNMRCLAMFITAVCLLFLLKLKWPKKKSVYSEGWENSDPPELSGPRDRFAIFMWMVGLLTFIKNFKVKSTGKPWPGKLWGRVVSGTQDHINRGPKGYSILLNPFWNHWLSLQSDWLSGVRFIHESHYFLL